MDPKRETVAAYDTYAARFDEEYERHMRRYNLMHADAFADALHGRSVLDVGAGPGNHAAYFVGKGLDVLCGDLSAEMVALCRRKGLPAIPLDLETFGLPEQFDGIWANACLLHLPKASVPGVIDRLAHHLEPRGVLGVSVKEGEGERILTDDDYPGTRRRFSYFADDEFRALLLPRFDIERFERTETRSRKTVFLKYVARIRAS
jgi:SAM-dependent methyltransferase